MTPAARRRIRSTAVALAVSVAGFAAGLAVASAGAPRPLVVAEAVADPDRPEWAPQDAGALRLFELGDVEVWAFETGDRQCLAFVDRGVRTVAPCTPGGGELRSADFVLQDGTLRSRDGSIRADFAAAVDEGTIIRLVVLGERLEAWTAAPLEGPDGPSGFSFHRSDRPGVG